MYKSFVLLMFTNACDQCENMRIEREAEWKYKQEVYVH